MEDTKIVKHKITHKGAVLINFAYIYNSSENIAAIGVDMKTKRGEVISTGVDEKGVPNITLCAIKESLHLSNKYERDEPTQISFPEYKGWDIWCSDFSKYTIYICFVKPQIT